MDLMSWIPEGCHRKLEASDPASGSLAVDYRRVALVDAEDVEVAVVSRFDRLQASLPGSSIAARIAKADDSEDRCRACLATLLPRYRLSRCLPQALVDTRVFRDRA